MFILKIQIQNTKTTRTITNSFCSINVFLAKYSDINQFCPALFYIEIFLFLLTKNLKWWKTKMMTIQTSRCYIASYTDCCAVALMRLLLFHRCLDAQAWNINSHHPLSFNECNYQPIKRLGSVVPCASAITIKSFIVTFVKRQKTNEIQLVLIAHPVFRWQ